MGGKRLVLAALAAAGACLIAACESDQPKAPEQPPQTVEEFFEALEYGIRQDGKVFHATVRFHSTENGVAAHWATTEGWVDEGAELVRTHWQKGPDNTADLAERTIHIYTPDGVYAANLDGADDPSFRLPTDGEPCMQGVPSQALALVACGFLDFGGPDYELSVEASTFEGRATLALVGRYPVSSPVGSEEFSPGGPTPHPLIAAATFGEYRLHLDATTYLPLAAVSTLDSDPDRKVFGAEARYETEFVARSGLPGDWFEPASIGYVPPDEEERRILEDPQLQAPVYWLGRSFDPGNGLPALNDLFVNGYHPGLRAPGSDEPNIQVGLSYRGAGGAVRLDHYPPGDWEEFKARLGGNFPWTWCAEARQFDAGDATVTILAGHESFPYDEHGGTVTIVRPGETPPTPAPPTVPPLKTEPCPATPHDRFMAEVRFPDATIVINGTLSYGGQDGRAWGVYDTAEALEVVARALRPRQPGE